MKKYWADFLDESEKILGDYRVDKWVYLADEVDAMKETIRNLCTEGLVTDGGDHKQWFLEEILKALGYGMDEIIKSGKTLGYEFDRGIAP